MRAKTEAQEEGGRGKFALEAPTGSALRDERNG